MKSFILLCYAYKSVLKQLYINSDFYIVFVYKKLILQRLLRSLCTQNSHWNHCLFSGPSNPRPDLMALNIFSVWWRHKRKGGWEGNEAKYHSLFPLLAWLWASFWKYVGGFPVDIDIPVVNVCKFPLCTFSPLLGRTSVRLAIMHCSVAMRKKRRETGQEERLSDHQNLPFGLRRDGRRTTPDGCTTTEPCHLSH